MRAAPVEDDLVLEEDDLAPNEDLADDDAGSDAETRPPASPDASPPGESPPGESPPGGESPPAVDPTDDDVPTTVVEEGHWEAQHAVDPPRLFCPVSRHRPVSHQPPTTCSSSSWEMAVHVGGERAVAIRRGPAGGGVRVPARGVGGASGERRARRRDDECYRNTSKASTPAVG